MEDDEEGEEGGKGAFDKSIMPEVVVVLDATDDFLKERIMNLPEEVVQVRHNEFAAFTFTLRNSQLSVVN